VLLAGSIVLGAELDEGGSCDVGGWNATLAGRFNASLATTPMAPMMTQTSSPATTCSTIDLVEMDPSRLASPRSDFDSVRDLLGRVTRTGSRFVTFEHPLR
jgi:hypothetical protein